PGRAEQAPTALEAEAERRPAVVLHRQRQAVKRRAQLEHLAGFVRAHQPGGVQGVEAVTHAGTFVGGRRVAVEGDAEAAEGVEWGRCAKGGRRQTPLRSWSFVTRGKIFVVVFPLCPLW